MISLAAACFFASFPQQSPAIATSTYAASGYRGFGMIVAKAGDVNADGVPDLIVGDDGDSIEFRPTFWILSGKDGSVIRRIVGPELGAYGDRVDGGEDLDGDKVPDLIIVTPTTCVSANEALYIVSGKTGEVRHHVPLRGLATGHGDWVRIVSDFDHDGLADIALLCPQKFGQDRGALSIYSGRSGELITDIKLANECGGTEGGFLEAGDVDGDGANDFVVLIHAARGNFGSTRLVSSSKAKVLWDVPLKDALAHGAMTLVADADKDGARDIAVGLDDVVDVLSVRTGARIYRLTPSHPNPGFVMGYGRSLATIGDILHDGNIAFAIAETEDVAGVVRAFCGRSGNELWDSCTRMEEDVTMFGYRLAAIGDIDGDGVSDLAVGTWEGPMGDYGLARVISGRSGKLLFEFRRKGDDVFVAKRGGETTKPR